MSTETLFPTSGMRWFVVQEEKILQQRFVTPAGTERWVDVPVVENRR